MDIVPGAIPIASLVECVFSPSKSRAITSFSLARAMSPRRRRDEVAVRWDASCNAACAAVCVDGRRAPKGMLEGGPKTIHLLDCRTGAGKTIGERNAVYKEARYSINEHSGHEPQVQRPIGCPRVGYV